MTDKIPSPQDTNSTNTPEVPVNAVDTTSATTLKEALSKESDIEDDAKKSFEAGLQNNSDTE